MHGKEVNNVRKIFERLFKEEEGQGLVEYGLILALVAVAVIGVLTLLGGEDDDSGLRGIFTKVTDELEGAGS